MGFVHSDRVKETTTTTGTGTYSLAGVVTGFRTFVAGVGSGNRCIYCVENGTDWEINEGVVTDAAPDTLTRARLLASSTGSAISWGAGTKNIFAVYAAADQNPRALSLTADYTNATTTGTEVTGLSTSLEPGTYKFEYFLIVRSSSTTVGIEFGLNFTGTQTALVATALWLGTGVSASTGIIDQAAGAAGAEQLFEGTGTVTESTTAPNMDSMTGFSAAGADHFAKIEGVIVVTVAGDLELWSAAEAAGTVSIMSGSSLEIVRTN